MQRRSRTQKGALEIGRVSAGGRGSAKIRWSRESFQQDASGRANSGARIFGVFKHGCMTTIIHSTQHGKRRIAPSNLLREGFLIWA